MGHKDILLTPIVLFNVSPRHEGTSSNALKLSKHQTSRYVTVVKEQQRNPTYICDVYDAMVAFIPYYFNDPAFRDNRGNQKSLREMQQIFWERKNETKIKIWPKNEAYVQNFMTVSEEYVSRRDSNLLKALLKDAIERSRRRS